MTVRTRNPLLRELRSSPIAQVSLVVTIAYLALSLAAPWVAPYQPTALITGPRLPPSNEHWLGTDEVGRDVLSRLLAGGRVAILVGVFAIAIGVMVGGTVGMLSAYFGGWVDSVLMRSMDVLLAFPGLLLALTLVVLLGPSLFTTIAAIGVSMIPSYARLVRSEALSLLTRDFVVASVALGATGLRVMAKHILPMAASSIVVFSTAQLARAILYEAGLSYLGLGIQPPQPSWGGMISSGQRTFLSAPTLAIFPGITIMVLVYALNLLGDSLRDALDPTSR